MATTLRKNLYAVLLLAFMSLFLFADQNLLAPNLTQIADEFGFTPEQRDVKLGGDISLWFWLVGGVVTLPIGYMTDRVTRKWLLGAVILIGEIPCLLTGFAETYEQLFWLRVLTGLGIGGAMPLVYSLIGDYFPATQRAKAAAYIGFAMGMGIAVGQVMAGFLGPQYGWRLPFIVVAIPNFALAAVFLFTIKEPARGQTEDNLKHAIAGGHAIATHNSWRDYIAMFKIPSNVLVFLQGVLGTVPWGVFFVYLNDYFAQDKGYSVENATLIVLAIGAASILGTILGGLWGNRVYNRSARNLPLLCGISTLVGVIPTAILINYPSQAGVDAPNLLPPLLIGAAAGFAATITAPNVRAMLLNVNSPETRGSIFALFNLADDLGKGFGPVVISTFIIAWGRESAFNVAVAFWLGCGALLLLLIRTFPRDEDALNQTLAERAKAIENNP